MEERRFYNLIATIRIEKGIPAEEAADLLGMPIATYMRCEESIGFTYDELIALKNMFGVTLNYILGGNAIFEDAFSEEENKAFEEKKRQIISVARDASGKIVDEQNEKGEGTGWFFIEQ